MELPSFTGASLVQVRRIVFLFALALAGCGGCHDDDESGKDNPGDNPDGGVGDGSVTPPGPVCTNCTPVGPMTFKLPSPANATLWTTIPMEKVLKEAAPPDTTGDAITIYAAK